MDSKLSRRSFLKGGAAAAAGAAASRVALPQAVSAATGQELVTVLDLAECIGCEACVDACRDQWQATVPDPVRPIPDPFPDRVPVVDWSDKKDVRDRLTPYNFLYVEHLYVPHRGREVELHVPRRCMHCTNPPCTNLCPFGAGRIEANGIVHIDPEVCLGGAKCKKVCPWLVPQRQSGVGIYLDILPSYAGNGVMFKCHRCLELVREGEVPRCIEICPQKLQSIGPREAQLAKAESLARERAAADGASPESWRDYVYGLAENGGTGTIYVAPMPFAEVTAAVAADHAGRRGGGRGAGRAAGGAGRRGRGNAGRPHMGPAADAMADTENLTKALFLAPLAGLAAGLVKLFGSKAKGQAPDQAPDQSQKGEE
jgi:Fe-S-cluster-containing dehydrogenase component